MKKIISVILLFAVIGCNTNQSNSNSTNSDTSDKKKTSKDYVIGTTLSGDTLTLEDIEKTIDSLKIRLYNE